MRANVSDNIATSTAIASGSPPGPTAPEGPARPDNAELSADGRPSARLGAIVDALDVVIFTCAPNGEITWWPRAAERCYGFPADRIVGTPVSRFAVSAGNADRDVQLLSDTLRGGHVPPHRVAQIRADGTQFECFRALVPITDAAGGTVEVAVLSQPLDRSDEAEPAEVAYRWQPYGEHAASIAHDVNNVLGAVTNYAEFVSQDLADAASTGNPAEWQRLEQDVGRIRHAAERANALSSQLLDFDYQMADRRRTNDLNELVRGAAALLVGVAGERVDVDTSALDPDLSSTSVDVGEVERVLVNLVVNAAQAMPAGGALRIETANVTVEPREIRHLRPPDEQAVDLSASAMPGQYVCLSVTDNGVGMSADIAARAFEPQFTTKPGGTGLGLATVARIVRQSEGYVHLDSQIGDGTTVSVLLPADG